MLRNNKKMQILANMAVFCCLWFSASIGWSMQSYKVSDGDTIKVNISSNEMTRITVDGKGRLDSVWGASEVIDFKADKNAGELFFRPKANAPMAFSFFVRDDSGSTYTLVAQQKDIPSQTIVLKPKQVTSGQSYNPRFKSSAHVDRVKHLMKGMALGEGVQGYTFEDSKQTMPLWAETKIQLRRSYYGYGLLGEIFTVENVSGKAMTFHEKEFMNFGDKVVAVALERLSINAGETTFLYIVRNTAEAK